MRKSTHGFLFLSHDAYGAPLGGPSGRRELRYKKLDDMGTLNSLGISLSADGIKLT